MVRATSAYLNIPLRSIDKASGGVSDETELNAIREYVGDRPMTLDEFLDAYTSMSGDDQMRFSSLFADKYNRGKDATDYEGNAIEWTISWAEAQDAMDAIIIDRAAIAKATGE